MRRYAWTVDELATLRRLVAGGRTDVEIGHYMGRHCSTVGAKRRQLGLEPGRSPLLTAMMARVNKRRRVAAG